MEYMYPSYFYDFQCEASACKDTCCAAWEIMIDPVSLKKYKKYPGSFGSRLKNCINWMRKICAIFTRKRERKCFVRPVPVIRGIMRNTRI